MPANLDLTLLGWTGRAAATDTTPADVAGTFTWTLEVDDAGAGGIDTKLELEFSDGATDLAVQAAENTAEATAAADCTGLDNVDVEVSGLTISFSGDGGCFTSMSPRTLTYDPNDDPDSRCLLNHRGRRRQTTNWSLR